MLAAKPQAETKSLAYKMFILTREKALAIGQSRNMFLKEKKPAAKLKPRNIVFEQKKNACGNMPAEEHGFCSKHGPCGNAENEEYWLSSPTPLLPPVGSRGFLGVPFKAPRPHGSLTMGSGMLNIRQP